MKDQPFYKVETDGVVKYYLKGGSNEGSTYPDTEITEAQYAALEEFGQSAGPVSGDISEATILRLHQESDPASPLYKGSEPADGAVTSDTAAGTEPSKSYYEPTADNIDPVADATPAPQGTTTFTTEEVSKPYEAPEPEQKTANEVVAPEVTEPAVSTSPVAIAPTQEDAGITGA